MKKQVSTHLKISFKIFALILLISQTSCSESEYTKLVKTEMAKNIVNDSLVFGMKFGETRQEFYDQCWKLNNEGVIMQGPQNNFVQYDLPLKKGDSSQYVIRMLFYGIFNKDRIMTGMDMRFYYNAWSLWNKSLHADKLVPVIKDSLQTWYPGNDFIRVAIKKNEKELLVKVDGNRRIIIEPLTNNKDVNVRIDDLRYLVN
jgi:hypothetical protein